MNKDISKFRGKSLFNRFNRFQFNNFNFNDFSFNNLERLASLLLFIFLVLFSFVSCGKYAPPIPPEALAPKGVYNIQAIPYRKGVVLKWTGDTDDRRSKELKTMNGYYIERVCFDDNNLGSLKNDRENSKELDYKVIAVVNDNQIKIRESLKEDARKKGLSARRVRVPSEKLNFNYVDETIKENALCYYKITPFNQGNVRGGESAPIKVKFNGEDSFVMVTSKKDVQTQNVVYEN